MGSYFLQRLQCRRALSLEMASFRSVSAGGFEWAASSGSITRSLSSSYKRVRFRRMNLKYSFLGGRLPPRFPIEVLYWLTKKEGGQWREMEENPSPWLENQPGDCEGSGKGARASFCIKVNCSGSMEFVGVLVDPEITKVKYLHHHVKLTCLLVQRTH